jgi:O-antigen/teichoic acid export membrane protein
MAETRLISLTYLFLRATTASGALLAGIIQTFVFARVLTPERFSIFIIVGSFAVILPLIDLGLVKLLFVRLRADYLAGKQDEAMARNATAVVIFYASLALVGTLLCFAVTVAVPAISALEAAEYALFFMFAALNFSWLALRHISIAVDQFIFFEALEAGRRVGNTVIILAMLFGLPFTAFLVLSNLLWLILLALSIGRLRTKRVLTGHIRGTLRQLWTFLSAERWQFASTSTYAMTDLFVYYLPYMVVPIIFGLSGPTIIVDTALKIYRGVSLAYSAACDLLIPRQTKAFAERDARTLVRATLLAAALCAVPALGISALLIFAGKQMFALLLGPAATMPPAAIPVIIGLLLASMLQLVTHSVLVHSGFFKEVARIGILMVIAQIAITGVVVVAGADIIGFLSLYTGVYAVGALMALALMLRGPIRIAAGKPAAGLASGATEAPAIL